MHSKSSGAKESFFVMFSGLSSGAQKRSPLPRADDDLNDQHHPRQGGQRA